MKSIVNKKICKEIFVDQLEGNEIIAYKCKSIKSNGGYAVLARLHGNVCGTSSYGFIPLGDSNSKPRYVGRTWIESIRLASEGRALKVFDSLEEMLIEMKNQSF